MQPSLLVLVLVGQWSYVAAEKSVNPVREPSRSSFVVRSEVAEKFGKEVQEPKKEEKQKSPEWRWMRFPGSDYIEIWGCEDDSGVFRYTHYRRVVPSVGATSGPGVCLPGGS